MKKIFYIIIFLILPLLGEAQKFFYNGEYNPEGDAGEEKNILTVDKYTLGIFFKEEFAYKNRDSLLVNPIIVNKVVSDGSEDILYAQFGASEEINDIEAFLSSMGVSLSDLKGYSYGYTYHSDVHFWPTMDVVFRLSPGSSIEDIQSVLDEYDASFVRQKYGVYTYTVPNLDDIFDLSNAIFESGKSIWSQPDYYTNYVTTTDPSYPFQFFLDNTGQTVNGEVGVADIDMDAPDAWTITTGTSVTPGAIRVAVLDDGVEPHEDLKTPSGADRVQSGYTPNCVTGCDGFPRNSGEHGEAVAGIIAASHNNLGGRGVAPDIIILPIRIQKGGWYGGDFFSNNAIADAMGHAWDEFLADIFNCSWGLGKCGEACPKVVEDAIQIARANGRLSKGTVVVFSSGNSSCSNGQPPGNVSGVICAGALDLKGNLTNYSTFGPQISLVTPSSTTSGTGNGNVRTTDRMGIRGYNTASNGNYTLSFGGTSAAAPQASGVAALMLAVNPDMTENEVRCRMTMSTVDMGAPGFDNTFGYGRLNAYYAVAQEDMIIHDKTFGGIQKFSASNSITAGPACVIQNTGSSLANVELTSGNTISLKPGFHAEEGTLFHASISSTGPCGNGPLRLNGNGNSPNAETNTPNMQIEKQSLRTASKFPLIYPNPSTGIFSISILNDKVNSITILNMQGEIVYSVENIAKGNIPIDLTKEPKGIYCVKIQNRTGIYTDKFIIQ